MQPPDVDIPDPALIVLIGAAGAGKTRVATAFPHTWRLSRDDCRERVSDNAGDQAATADAMLVFDAVLNGRLTRRRPTLIDATNTETAARRRLVERAHQHGMPAVAITVRTPLADCLARQATRPANRQVPVEAVTRQHQNQPGVKELLDDGFDQVHDATELDLLGMLLERAASEFDGMVGVRQAFGPVADAFTWTTDPADPGIATGVIAIAGRELTIRWRSESDPFNNSWQARVARWQVRVDGTTCESCDGPLWVTALDSADLLDVYIGRLPDEARCGGCDAPADATIPEARA